MQRSDQLAKGLCSRADDLGRALDVDLGQAIEQGAHLLGHQRLQRLAVAQRVIDGEAERLVVPAGPEPAYRASATAITGAI